MKSLFLFTIVIISTSLVAKEINFSILHTNDLHSYVGGSGPDSLFTKKINDHDPVFGHYSRLTHLIKNKKTQNDLKNEPYLLIDAGDFYAGTLFQILAPDPKIPLVPELEFFLFNKYDFAAIGNHEFDAKDIGFYTMLKKINDRKGNFKILSSNLVFENKDSPLKEFWKPYTGFEHDSLITNYYIKEIEYNNQKVKIGVIGILGPDGAKVSYANRHDTSFVGHHDKEVKHDFKALYELLQRNINELKLKYSTDIIILTMHGGAPEDEKIAENVKGIDIIIAGHTHKLYKKPKIIKNTIITQVECYGKYLGVLDLKYDGEKVSLQNNNDTYILVDDRVPTDSEYDKLIHTYKDAINKKLVKYNFKYDSPIFKAKNELKRKDLESLNPLGQLITTGIKKEFNKQILNKENKIDLFFTTMGLIRTDLIVPVDPTPYQLSDTYKFLPLGMSKDGDPGFPIVHFYLHKSDVRLLINFLEIYKYVSGDYTPVFSDNLTYRVNDYGIPQLNRLKDLKLDNKEYKDWPEYISIGTNSYIAEHIDEVGPMSYGLVNFSAHDKKGNKMNMPYYTDFKEFKLFSDYLKNAK